MCFPGTVSSDTELEENVPIKVNLWVLDTLHKCCYISCEPVKDCGSSETNSVAPSSA